MSSYSAITRRSLGDEREDVLTELGPVLAVDAVRGTRVYLQRAVLDELGRLQRRRTDRDDLVVIAVRDEDRHVQRLEILGEVGLRERCDAVVGSREVDEHPL